MEITISALLGKKEGKEEGLDASCMDVPGLGFNNYRLTELFQW